MPILRESLAAAVAATLAVPATAQTYPERPVTIVFPNKAGAGYHNAVLAVLDEMEDLLPVAVNVTTMPGAGTSAGTRYVQSQADDGYTLLFIHEAIFTSSALGMLNFDPLEEFEAVARVVQTCGGLFAAASEPFDDFAGMVAYGKDNPGALRAAVNTGAISHVEVLSVDKMTGANLTPVHVGGGTSGFSQAAMAGDVDLISASPGSVSGIVASGDVIPLAYYGKERHPDFADVPTLAELGYDAQDVCIGGYFWMPRGAPEEAKTFWNDAIGAAMTAEAEARLEDRLSMDFGFLGRADLAELTQQKYEEWTGMMKAAGVGQ